jgi:hypothetical protein
MPYIKPDYVTSPKDSWTLNCIIYDEGEGKIAVAYGVWDKERVIAMRWNGKNDLHKELGNPQSSGNATWFILPREIGITIVKDILIKQAAGNTSVRKHGLAKVIEWLIDFKVISLSGYEAKAY